MQTDKQGHPIPPLRFEDAYPEVAAHFELIFRAGGRFAQPRDKFGRMILAYVLPELGPVAGVARNGPCPCGSGLKFKRCHDNRQ